MNREGSPKNCTIIEALFRGQSSVKIPALKFQILTAIGKRKP